MNFFEKLKTIFVSGAFSSMAIIFVVLLLLWDIFLRQEAVREINGQLLSYQMSRVMLNSRAQIQIILLNAAIDNRALTPTEIDTIKTNWTLAEYHEVRDVLEEKEKGK